MKKTILAAVFSLCCMALNAQERSSVFNILKIPTSAHAAALGGNNVSLVDDDATLAWGNPALLASVSDKSLNLNFMTYLKGGKMGSAAFVKTMGERHTFGVRAQFLDYGSMDETDDAGNALGTFSAKDIVIGGLYSYQLNDRWVGGAALHFVYSKYAEYSSMALSVDLGLNYFDEEHDFSLGVAMRNIGAQVKRFDERAEHLPFALEAGATKGIEHMPLRLSLTMIDITRWKSSYYYSKEADKSIGFGQKLLNHFVVGVDVLPTDYLYFSLGYNPRRAYELKSADQGHWAGFSFGAGLELQRFKLGVTYAQYRQSAGSVLCNVSYVF